MEWGEITQPKNKSSVKPCISLLHLHRIRCRSSSSSRSDYLGSSLLQCAPSCPSREVSEKMGNIPHRQNAFHLNGCKSSTSNVIGPQTPCLFLFWNWENSPFSILGLWGKKNWPPSIKVNQIENSQNKMGLKGCKWSSLKAPGTQTPLSHSLLELGKLPFLSISHLGWVIGMDAELTNGLPV